MNHPLLSLCIPTYNRSILLSDLLASIERDVQPFRDAVEIVVSDNCSDDDTIDVVRAFQDRLDVRYFRQERNIGQTANICFVPSLATGTYCWILGSDDLLVPGAIRELLTLLEQYPSMPAIVVGYSYEQEMNRTKIREREGPPEFQRPVFKNLHAPTCLQRWEDSFLETDKAALHTSIVSCVFARRAWEENKPDVRRLTQIDSFVSLESTFPYALTWASFLVGRAVVFAPMPQVYFFVGAQEWFRPMWTSMVFSFCLQLARNFRHLGAREDAVRYYESSLLQHPGLLQLVLEPNEYSRTFFSLPWLMEHYGSRPELWQGIVKTCNKNHPGKWLRLIRKLCWASKMSFSARGKCASTMLMLGARGITRIFTRWSARIVKRW